MKLAGTATPPTTGQQAFAQRVAELGLTCWFVDATGCTTAASTTFAADNDASDEAIVLAARRAMATDAVELDARTLDLIAFPWSPDAIVVELAEAPGLGRAALIAVLKHFHADLRRTEKDAKAIEGFSQQLSQSYEEVNLIYRMAKLLTSAAEPGEVVQSMCDELRQTLNYGWLAMSFTDGDAVLASLRRTLRHAGPLPLPREEFRAECPPLNGSDRILLPNRHTLATRTQSEVLVERVTHDETPIGVLVAGNRQGVESDVTSSELQLVEAAGNFLGLFHQNAFRFAEQRRQFLGTLHALSAAVDAKDPYTRGHSERVALLASQLAIAIGLDADLADAIRVAGLLHDIGKIGVPEAVLRKPARLTDEEFDLIKKHPETGYEILKDLPSLTYHLPGVLHHHERWDGRGYPHGLKGDAIPLIARILAFADTFDAMSSSRAYRTGMPRERVLSEIRKSSGTQLDPTMIEAFVTLDFTAFDQMLHTEAPQPAATPASAW